MTERLTCASCARGWEFESQRQTKSYTACYNSLQPLQHLRKKLELASSYVAL